MICNWKTWFCAQWFCVHWRCLRSALCPTINRWCFSSYLECYSSTNFPLWDAPARNHGSCLHHLGLDVCFYEYNHHDSLLARVIEGMIHLLLYSLERHSCLALKTLRQSNIPPIWQRWNLRRSTFRSLFPVCKDWKKSQFKKTLELSHYRLLVHHPSLSPSCLTRKKTAIT